MGEWRVTTENKNKKPKSDRGESAWGPYVEIPHHRAESSFEFWNEVGDEA